jgi:hypothetical protein
MTVTTKPDHRGDHVISRTTIARGMPDDFGVTVVTMLVCFFIFAREAAGASSARHSLRPLNFRCASDDSKLARITWRDRGGVRGCVAVKTGTACVCELRDVIAYSTTASAVFIPPTCGDKKGRPSLRGANATKRSRFPVWCVGPMDCFAALAMTNVKMRLAVWRF